MTVRERLLDAAHGVIEESGWAAVTMAGIAGAAGVSRQTVYNEFGTKHGLAEQLAMRELQRFLGVVRRRMEAETDLVEGIRSACEGVLVMGEDSLLVRTIVGTAPGDQDNDLLQILTTESGEIAEAAVMVVQEAVVNLYPATPLTTDELAVAVESVVRLVLSAITRPSKSAAQAAADIAWIVGLTLDGAELRGPQLPNGSVSKGVSGSGAAGDSGSEGVFGSTVASGSAGDAGSTGAVVPSPVT